MKTVLVELNDMLEDTQRSLFEEQKELANLEKECAIKRNLVKDLMGRLDDIKHALSKLG